MIRPEHPFDIRPDLRKAASTEAASVISHEWHDKAESTCKEESRTHYHVISEKCNVWIDSII
jgi:hypothetical protein